MNRRIHVGRFTLTSLPRESKAVEPDTDGVPYLAALEELGRLLMPGSWALAGGLAVPVTVGGFYRRHTDVDIVLALDALPAVAQAFRANGYELYTNWKVTHHSRGLLLEYRIRTGGPLARLWLRRLYVKRFDRISSLLGKIDLYPYRIVGDHLETCNTKRVLSRAMQRSSLTPFNRRGWVTCLNLDNVARLKSLRSGAKHQLDCAVIRDGPGAATEWFRRFAASPPAQAAGRTPVRNAL